MKADEEAAMMHQVALKMKRWSETTKNRVGPPKIPKKDQTYESVGGLQFKVTGCTSKEVTVEVDRVVRKKGDKQTTEVRTRVVPVALFESFARAYTLQA